MLRLRMLMLLALLVPSALEAQSDELVVLSPHWEGVRTEFTRGFQARYRRETGRNVDVRWLDVGGTSDILKFIRSEYRSKPDGIGVDLFFGGGTDPYEELLRLGFLEPYAVPDSILSGVASRIGGIPLVDADGHWYAATMAGFGIIYNKAVLKRLGLPEPRTWEDLAHPDLFTWVGSADPRKSGSVHMAYEIMLQAYGWERGWQVVTALGGNVRGFSANAASTPKDVAVGEVAYGLAIDSYAWHQVREVGEEMIGFVMPEDLTVVNGDAIAVLRGADHRDVARAFVRYVLSEEGQKLWMLNIGEPGGPEGFELGKFSVRPGLYDVVKGRTAVSLNPFLWRSSFVYEPDKGSSRWGIVNDLIGTQLIDAHDALTAAWQVGRVSNPDAAADLGRVPLTEEQAAELAASWRDPSVRNVVLGEWAAFAREKYGDPNRGFARNVPALLALTLGVVMFVWVRRTHR